jgi:hypothetical protein
VYRGCGGWEEKYSPIKTKIRNLIGYENNSCYGFQPQTSPQSCDG